MQVLLPAPLAPMRPNVSPSETAKEMALSAACGLEPSSFGYVFEILLNVIILKCYKAFRRSQTKKALPVKTTPFLMQVFAEDYFIVQPAAVAAATVKSSTAAVVFIAGKAAMAVPAAMSPGF